MTSVPSPGNPRQFEPDPKRATTNGSLTSLDQSNDTADLAPTMKTTRTIAATLLSTCLLFTATSYAQPAGLPKQRSTPQSPLLDIALPPAQQPSTARPAPAMSSDGTSITLSDVIGRDRSINIFAGFTRDIDSIAARLDSSAQNTTVLAPVNGAVTSLPRKPWEDPAEYARLGAEAYEGLEGEGRAHRNLRRFVEAHVVPESPWQEGKKVQTLAGGTVWWERKDGVKRVRVAGARPLLLLANVRAQIQPGNVEVTSVPSKVGNGEVWILNEALNYA